MKLENIENILTTKILAPSKWELDEIVYPDRTSNPKTLIDFLKRIQELSSKKLKATDDEFAELAYLLELLEELDEDECNDILSLDDDKRKSAFIENLARISAIEVLTNGRMTFDTMSTACKLSPNDFIICAKRTQDLINAIQGLVIKGEVLSKDIAGA